MLLLNKIIIITACACSLFLQASGDKNPETPPSVSDLKRTSSRTNFEDHTAFQLPKFALNRACDDDDPLDLQSRSRSRSESPASPVMHALSVFEVCDSLFTQHPKPGTLLLDIDGTVLNEIDTDVNFGKLLESNLPKLLEAMRNAGWKVVFFTARKFQDTQVTYLQLSAHGLLAGSPYNSDDDVQFRVFANGTYFTNHDSKGNHIHYLLNIINHEDGQIVCFIDNNRFMLDSVWKMRPETILHYMIGSSPQ